MAHRTPAMMTAARDSDSDDHELPEKEPEFIIHVVDDHSQPAPPRQMYRPPAVAYHLPPPVALPQLDHGDDDGPKECTWCFCIKCLHFAVVMSMALVTLSVATRLPEEYRTGGDRVFILVGPVVIGVLALSWIVLALFDKERC